MRTIAICAILAMLPGLAYAQDEGLTTTSSSAGIGGEVAALDTDFLGGQATMVGANAHFQAGSLLRLEGRYLTGTMSSDYFYTGTRTNERAHLLEGEATLGFAAGEETRLFIGGSLRGLSNPSIPNGDRLSTNAFGILGVAKKGRISSRWTAITQLAGGILVYGQEDVAPEAGDFLVLMAVMSTGAVVWTALAMLGAWRLGVVP